MAESKGRMILTAAILREAAGQVYFARGEGYFEIGAVRSVREREGAIKATVSGSQPYTTSLLIREDGLDGHCTCPLGQDGQFCKHLVATGLAFIDQQEAGRKMGKGPRPITPKDIEDCLLKLDRSDLVRLIMEQADFDDELYAALRLRTASDGAEPNTAEMKQVIRQAIEIQDFISWRETSLYEQGVDRVLAQLRTMLTQRHAAEVIKLAEFAMDLWEENIGLIDDSDGCMGMIRDDLHQLHLEACEATRPDPVELAERLAQRAINSEWEMFFDAYRTHNTVFGTKGRARYREIVETQWEKLPYLEQGEEDSDCYGRSSRLQYMMLAFAEENDDLALAIRILSRDLSHPYRYLQIAQRCREARKHKLACEWAEKGVANFPENDDSRLRSFLAEEYVRSHRPDNAMAMIWANFEARTSAETFRELAKYARRLKCWKAWRERSFVHMRQQIKDSKIEFEKMYGNTNRGSRSALRWAPRPPDHSILVEILLWEKNESAAWAEAKTGGCSEYLWLDMAQRREKTNPEDAIEVYRRQVEPLINHTKNASYEKAVDFLGRIHRLMREMGNEKDFRTELLRLKNEYKRKRNFIKYVERHTWGK
jgi:uncharacterized Zn finger protein